MTKEALRKIYLSKRLDLSEETQEVFTRKLSGHFFNYVDLGSVSVLHSFLSISKNKEPDTWIILNRIRTEFPSIRISLPKINSQTGHIESIYFENTSQLKPNSLGIPEPTTGISTDTRDIDIVLVPLLCFDKKGNRIGYGKGYYDKFLSLCRKDCRKIGLSFFEPVDSIDDVNSLDIPLDICVTPEKIFTFGA